MTFFNVETEAFRGFATWRAPHIPDLATSTARRKEKKIEKKKKSRYIFSTSKQGRGAKEEFYSERRECRRSGQRRVSKQQMLVLN